MLPILKQVLESSLWKDTIRAADSTGYNQEGGSKESVDQDTHRGNSRCKYLLFLVQISVQINKHDDRFGSKAAENRAVSHYSAFECGPLL